MHWERPWAAGGGKPNLGCSVEEKMLEAIFKNEMIWVTKNKHSSLSLHKISTEFDNNLKTTLKWCWKMVFVHSLRCSPKNDSLLFLITAQIVEWKLEQLEVEDHKLT